MPSASDSAMVVNVGRVMVGSGQVNLLSLTVAAVPGVEAAA
jgi:hypothetical protein